MPAQAADWRLAETAGQNLALQLHRAAANDLAATPELWPGMPTDGPVRDLLQARLRSRVPWVRLSSAAGELALVATLTEMGERLGSQALGWQGDSLKRSAKALAHWVPELGGSHLPALAAELPDLRRAAASLGEMDDPSLALLCGRVAESAISCFWVFTEQGGGRRVWNPWHAKKQGCFFTPRFVARHLFREAGGSRAQTVLDPASGAGALLIEAFLELEAKRGPDAALDALYGVDIDPALTAVCSLALEFLAGRLGDGRPRTLGSRFVVGDALLMELEGDDSWRVLFPEVLNSGGFDAVVMNPPYGQLKVNRSSLPSEPGDAPNATSLRERALTQARAQSKATAAQLKAHPDYRHAHGGVPDLPRFFIERALSIARPGGRLACIVPSTFLADHRSKGLRRHLLEDHALKRIDLFPEDIRMFTGVNQPTCVIVAQAKRSTGLVRLRRNVRSGSDLRCRPLASIDRSLIDAIDPVGLRIPNCSGEDLEALRQMHAHPSLEQLKWVVNLRGELDLTTHAQFLRSGRPGRPLVRGSQIERYRSDVACGKSKWVHGEFVEKAISARKAAFVERPRIVVRQCSYLDKPWRISATLAQPGSIVANSCNFLAVGGESGGHLDKDEALLFLLGVLNSSIVDWRFRLMSSTNHVGNYELASLPIPVPEAHKDVRSVAALTLALLTDPGNREADDEIDRVVNRLYGL